MGAKLPSGNPKRALQRILPLELEALVAVQPSMPRRALWNLLEFRDKEVLDVALKVPLVLGDTRDIARTIKGNHFSTIDHRRSAIDYL